MHDSSAGEVDGANRRMGIGDAVEHSLAPHTMCASGKYTMNIQATMKAMIEEYFMRSAIAPTIRAGVMIANINWYIAKTL